MDGKFSINFENKDQYKSFIESIKNEVLKEMPNKGDVTKNTTIWNYAKSKIEELGMKPHENEQLKQAISTILRFGFKTRTVHLMPEDKLEEIKPYIDELFNSIIGFRDFKRPPAYQEHWVINEEENK